MKFQCDNCGHVCDEDDTVPAKNLSERLSPGSVYTDRECPECGALAYPVEDAVPSAETGLPSVTIGDFRVDWVNLGEGYNGDYSPDDPENENLLRFEIFILDDEGDFEAVEGGLYRTGFTAATPAAVLALAAGHIIERVKCAESIKRCCEELSGLSVHSLKTNLPEIGIFSQP